MRIIRTGRTTPLPVHSGARVDKGWVREGILSGLSVEPSTLTEISRRLGVSKSTASYHLSLLTGRGVIEVVDSWVGRGGVQMKRYGLREGSLVTLLSRGQEEAELGKMRETFDLQALAWESSEGAITFDQIQNLLYRMFLHLFKIGRSEHRTLMRVYGNRVGAIMARRTPQAALKETLFGLTTYFARSGISESDLLELPNSSVSIIVSNTCIGTSFHQSNSCYFLEGIIEGAVRAKAGPNVKVGRVTVQGISSCIIAIGRVKHLESDRIAEAVLTSPHYSAINRRRLES